MKSGVLLGRLGALVLALAAWLATPVAADTVQLNPIKDNSLYEIANGSLSNGAGSYLFAGTTAVGDLRRALLAFDIAGNIPEGSTIESVTLTLNVSKEPLGNMVSHDFFLHRASADWGEGSSDAPGEEGTGAPSSSGDATWIHRFFDTTMWATDGGDFVASASATQGAGPGLGPVSWTGSGLVDDVQAWLDSPASNFGWFLLGEEGPSAFASARRFDSRTGPVVPVLEIDFTPEPVSVGEPRAAPLRAWVSPNPAVGSGTIRFVTPRSGAARLELFDITGRHVGALFESNDLAAGTHEFVMGTGLNPGVYFYRLRAAQQTVQGRFLLLD